MKRSRIERARSRFAPGEHFGAISTEVLGSDAYAALPDYAVRVLIAISGQYRGNDNGNLSLTQLQALSLGVVQAWKVQAGLELLVATGLLVRTRQGKYRHGKPVCALYALSWKEINPTPQAYPPIEYKRPAPNGWARWTRPADWDDFERQARQRAQGRGSRRNGFSMINPVVLAPINPVVSGPGETAKADQPGCIGKEAKVASLQSTRGGVLLESGRGSGLSPGSDSIIPGARNSRRPRANRKTIAPKGAAITSARTESPKPEGTP